MMTRIKGKAIRSDDRVPRRSKRMQSPSLLSERLRQRDAVPTAGFANANGGAIFEIFGVERCTHILIN